MDYKAQYQRWMESPALSQEEKAELTAIAGDEKEMESRFFSQLSFGTAGLRGTMGVGLYRMNVHVVRHATQAFAQVILEEGPEAAAKGVAVCYDCRNNSELFAHEAACVMAANGIPVRLFDSLRPTPELSFAIREYGCIAGINITASHNPKEYNGYKVYWSDGAQLPPGPADKVAAKMQELDVFDCVKTMDYKKALDEGRITLMGTETDEKFLANVMEQVNDQRAVDAVADTFKMVYTPFHGTGYKLIPEALRRLGMKHVICVPQQMIIDGDFPTVVSPNPENPEGFALAVDIAKREGADFILGSDPDADRVGIMVRTKDDDFVVISGNQTGVLLLDYLIGAKTRTGKMPANPVALKSLVTTEMARKVAEDNGLKCFDTFTGFKFLAEKKDQLESSGEGNVIMSYEESFGYMLGSFVRDKDAVTASVALTEMAAWYAGQGMTLYDALQGLYEKYGHFGERTMNLVMPGLDGLKKMAQLMADLRANPPKEVGGTAVAQWKDYKDGSVVDAATGDRTTMELSGSNVLRYELVDGTSVIVRPSGTEPKVKVYILARGESQADCAAKVERYAAWAESLKG
ncbi:MULTISPECIES: phospho-sugar mutase [unclassified Pseudoflavonifractor]|uniref:phospho-sugar mutase n=1 Tax=unclassified Pseudoflavonifractor TaxID=2628103 RepID=UPI000B3AA861|nr:MULTISPECIES: phospho-sugar mutase [unclassified Pseudoflavonifractor]NJE74115.1 phospho-sugar mutase [Pseudoflavonifractor sp. SW1122]OUP45128.1 phosphoglucomutase [Pseudoflavonifractor sp. An187]